MEFKGEKLFANIEVDHTEYIYQDKKYIIYFFADCLTGKYYYLIKYCDGRVIDRGEATEAKSSKDLSNHVFSILEKLELPEIKKISFLEI